MLSFDRVDGPTGAGLLDSRVRLFAGAPLLSLCHAPLVLTIDGSIVGCGCMTLTVSVIYITRVTLSTTIQEK